MGANHTVPLPLSTHEGSRSKQTQGPKKSGVWRYGGRNMEGFEERGVGMPKHPKRTGALTSNLGKNISVAFNIVSPLFPILDLFHQHADMLNFANIQRVVLLFRNSLIHLGGKVHGLNVHYLWDGNANCLKKEYYWKSCHSSLRTFWQPYATFSSRPTGFTSVITS